MDLKLLTVGSTSTRAVALPLLITNELLLSCSGQTSVSKELCSTSCIPALIDRGKVLDAGRNRLFLGTSMLVPLSLRKALDPFPFTGFECRWLSCGCVCVTTGRAGR